VHPQHGQIVVDLMAAFDGEDSGNLLLLDNALDIASTGRKLDLVRMLIEDALHGIAQIERPAHGFGAVLVSRDPEREEWNMNAALAKARDVEHAIGQTLR